MALNVFQLELAQGLLESVGGLSAKGYDTNSGVVRVEISADSELVAVTTQRP